MIPEKFAPRKFLSQNFLINQRVIERIIEVCDLKKDDVVLEIGPGRGALTRDIAKRVQELIVIERDERLVQELEKREEAHLKVIHADVLRYPLENLPQHLKVIGNLPYHIATPIVERLIGLRHHLRDVYIMLQWEHGQRLIAKPHTKDYGSLSCFVQYYTIPKILFKISSAAFSPRPKVDSCFLHLKLLEKPFQKAKDEDLLFKIIRQAFSQRRKMIQNSLSPLIPKERLLPLLKELNVEPEKRAENLRLEDYVRIGNALTEAHP